MADKPILRPYAQYLLGLLMVTQRTGGGNTAYFMGEVSSTAWKSYFPIVYLIKEPIPILILLLLAIFLTTKKLFLTILRSIVRKGKFGSFAACNLYPKCKTTFSLPNNALIKPSDKVCETCGFPMVTAIKARKKPQEFCLNPKCKSKHVEGEAGEQAKAIAKGEIERKCPKCKDGNIVLRKSIYGSFYGCSNYPKCRYTEKLAVNP